MTSPPVRQRIAPIGLICLAVTSVGWGLNWPVMKILLTEWPPLSARGLCGVVGGASLAIVAMMRGESLKVPKGQGFNLFVLSALNVSGWMALMGLAMLWLPASEAAVIAYTMPAMAAFLAWMILGERLSIQRILAMVVAFAGLATLMGGNGLSASLEKLPGIIMVLVGAFAFALGTVLAKKLPLTMSLMANSAWQIGLGCLPVAIAGLLIERPSIEALSYLGWSMLFYMTFIQFCIAYVCWFAALKTLPASVAAIGTMAVPVIGVVGSAHLLGEPLGPTQIIALVCTLVGVVLATRA